MKLGNSCKRSWINERAVRQKADICTMYIVHTSIQMSLFDCRNYYICTVRHVSV